MRNLDSLALFILLTGWPFGTELELLASAAAAAGNTPARKLSALMMVLSNADVAANVL
jgi:hypothetical protein